MLMKKSVEMYKIATVLSVFLIYLIGNSVMVAGGVSLSYKIIFFEIIFMLGVLLSIDLYITLREQIGMQVLIYTLCSIWVIIYDTSWGDKYWLSLAFLGLYSYLYRTIFIKKQSLHVVKKPIPLWSI